MKYFIFETGVVYLEETGASIPPDQLNTDYQRYLAWIDEGNTPLPWPPEES